MKEYLVKLDDEIEREIETVAKDVAHMPPEELIELFVIRALSPAHRKAKQFEAKGEQV